MILVIGGRAAGKRAFVERQLGYRAAEMDMACLTDRPVLCDLQQLLRESTAEQVWPALLRKEVIVCDEVGCGVVPVEAAERAWREEVGRACCRLAEQAETVVRVVAGLPQVLKGSL